MPLAGLVGEGGGVWRRERSIFCFVLCWVYVSYQLQILEVEFSWPGLGAVFVVLGMVGCWNEKSSNNAKQILVPGI